MSDKASSAKPKRTQRSREKGWKKPARAIYVGRPTEWGNPYSVDRLSGPYSTKDEKVEHVVRLFRGYAKIRLGSEPHWLDALRGKDLICWCRLDQPCHADVLLELANR